MTLFPSLDGLGLGLETGRGTNPYRTPRLAKRKINRQDTKRSRVYAAEGTALPHGPEQHLASIAEVQAYVDRVTDLAWFRRRWPTHTRIAAVIKRGGGGYAPVNSNRIHVGLNVTGARGKPGTTRALVLHEIAHVVTDLAPDDHNWHGPAFVRTALEIYGFEFGKATADAFRAACKEQKVRLGSPTPLRAPSKTPPPRAVPHTWRIQLGKDELLIVQATTLLGALDQLTSVGSGYRARLKATDATEIKVWKSRATSTSKAAKRS